MSSSALPHYKQNNPSPSAGKRRWLGLFTLCLIAFSGLSTAAFLDPAPILFESAESTASTGYPVFNRVWFRPGMTSDTWLMEQSHSGITAKKKKWDKIAIVVDDTRTAKFYQFENSEKDISMSLKTSDFRVSCYLCHSNGPRALRPNWQSKKTPATFWDKFRVQVWNLRIKSYGVLTSRGVGSQKPFRLPGHKLNQPLNIASCTKCHKTDGLLARGPLTRQNFMAIKYMVNSGAMPPPGFSLSESERQQLHEFLR